MISRKVLTASIMIGYDPNTTPSAFEIFGSDDEEENINESWEYISIFDMLVYSANNLRPGIAHSVYQYARYTHNPKSSYVIAVKHILRYLRGTTEKRIFLGTNNKHEVDCFVDSDFAEK